MQSGDSTNTSLALSQDASMVQPQSANSNGTFRVLNTSSENILSVDTTNSVVKTGASQVNALTLYKTMGLYDFSPGSAGYHHPLVSNFTGYTIGASAMAYDDDWGNATDPPTTLDVSGLTAPRNAVAIYWYLQNDITIDEIRYLATADSSATLNFHIFAYDLDTSSNHGDLSNGTLHANTSVAATTTTIKTGTFSLDTANISANKVVIGFVENETDGNDMSVTFNIKYHIR